MQPRRTLEVPLPASMELTALDAEVLKATFQALATLRCEKGSGWKDLARQMESDGWTVRWGLTWRAEAKQAGDYEEATGSTLDEAMGGLAQLAGLDMVGHVP